MTPSPKLAASTFSCSKSCELAFDSGTIVTLLTVYIWTWGGVKSRDYVVGCYPPLLACVYMQEIIWAYLTAIFTVIRMQWGIFFYFQIVWEIRVFKWKIASVDFLENRLCLSHMTVCRENAGISLRKAISHHYVVTFLKMSNR